MITSMENYTFNVREDEGIYIYFTTSSTTMHIRQGDSSIIWVTPAGWGWLAGGLQAVLLNIPSQPILTIKRVNIQCHSTLHIRT